MVLTEFLYVDVSYPFIIKTYEKYLEYANFFLYPSQKTGFEIACEIAGNYTQSKMLWPKVTFDSFSYTGAIKDLMIKMKADIKHYISCNLIAL